MTRRKIILALLFGWLIGAIIHEAKAGPFLDLDIGTHLTDWYDSCNYRQRCIGEENPIGIIRIGYETNTYRMWGPVDISAHGYYEHMSSAGNPDDTGIDVLMFGIRIE